MEAAAPGRPDGKHEENASGGVSPMPDRGPVPGHDPGPVDAAASGRRALFLVWAAVVVVLAVLGAVVFEELDMAFLSPLLLSPGLLLRRLRAYRVAVALVLVVLLSGLWFYVTPVLMGVPALVGSACVRRWNPRRSSSVAVGAFAVCGLLVTMLAVLGNLDIADEGGCDNEVVAVAADVGPLFEQSGFDSVAFDEEVAALGGEGSVHGGHFTASPDDAERLRSWLAAQPGVSRARIEECDF